MWTNNGKRSVRLLLAAGETPHVVTVLAPGQAFKQADKNYCLSAGADRRYEASFAVLAKPAVEEKRAAEKAKVKTATAAPEPRAKPALETAAPTGAVAAATAGASVPAPREKPEPPRAAPPMPREKPEGPAAAAVEAKAPAPSPAETAPLSAGAAACDRDCPPILFKVIDACLWVLNLNPRPVAFEAEAAGKRYALLLEAADGAKADERAAALGSATPPKNEASVHMRLKDPFQSAGSGIPVFRARLGAADACVKSRADITRFWARYTR
jgi:hypothetical protein